MSTVRRPMPATSRQITPKPTRIPFLSPTVPPVEDLVADYREIVASGVFSNGGRMDRQLVAAVEAWVGGGVYATTMCNCTAGIELAVRASFLPRPKALVAAFTFAAGPMTLVSAGYEPVLMDVSSESWQPSIEHARKLLEEHPGKFGGILLTATFGVAIERVAEWEDLAALHGLPLVIDSAAGFGAEYPWGERLGARGTCEVFSVHATKMVAAGEGGLITSRDPDLIAKLNQAKNFGFGSERAAVRWGTNAKLSELTGALALRQLDVLPERLIARRRVLRDYETALSPLGITFQPGAMLSAPAFVSALMPTATSRELAVAALGEEMIECRTYYSPPIHRQPFFAEYAGTAVLAVTDDLCARMISLPMADDLAADAIARVTSALKYSIER